MMDYSVIEAKEGSSAREVPGRWHSAKLLSQDGPVYDGGVILFAKSCLFIVVHTGSATGWTLGGKGWG